MKKPIINIKSLIPGETGNAYALLGLWSRAARQAGWGEDAVKSVIDKATSGDYTNLCEVLIANSRKG